jgi:hypothetical protein
MNSNLRYRVVAIDDRYHWIDRRTNQPVTFKDGSEARFDGLDEAVRAFIDGKLSVEKNEVI